MGTPGLRREVGGSVMRNPKWRMAGLKRKVVTGTLKTWLNSFKIPSLPRYVEQLFSTVCTLLTRGVNKQKQCWTVSPDHLSDYKTTTGAHIPASPCILTVLGECSRARLYCLKSPEESLANWICPGCLNVQVRGQWLQEQPNLLLNLDCCQAGHPSLPSRTVVHSRLLHYSHLGGGSNSIKL